MGMKKLNLPLITDTLFCGFCAFFISFTAVRHYTQALPLALTLGIFTFLTVSALTFLLIGDRQQKKLLIMGNAKERERLKAHLALLPVNEALKLIAPALPNVRTERYRMSNDSTAYYPKFGFVPVNENDVAQIAKRKTNKEKALLCNAATEEAQSLGRALNVEIILTDDLFESLKKGKRLPEKYLFEKAGKISVFKKIKSRLNKKLSPTLFLSGLGLLALSYFTFFPIYYLISGGILLLLAMLLLIFG